MRITAVVLLGCALLSVRLVYLLLTQGRPVVTRVDRSALAELPSVEALVDRLFDPERGGAPYVGASIAIVRPGEEAWLRGYGHEGVSETVPVDPAATRFRLGSVSKWFTAMAVARLIDEGRIGLNDRVNDHLTR
ncbi:serine hydrolase domain-containing protein [Algihabitans albus]|uniref:serine hydrolase domain-containing protein n=1 Tax=Algihabitans albus TaxID=2164067 RepID=UPI000E5D2D53|nr:serine hydrolase domain-containing protein [Algihabitans albus]